MFVRFQFNFKVCISAEAVKKDQAAQTFSEQSNPLSLVFFWKEDDSTGPLTRGAKVILWNYFEDNIRKNW
jgi:hypothetical protein